MPTSGLTRRNLLGVGGSLAVAATVGNANSAAAASQPAEVSLGLVPISPTRVYDSRLDMAPDASGPLSDGANRTVTVTVARDVSTGRAVGAAIPAAAKAIAYTLTIANTRSAGYLAMNPGGISAISASTINWSLPDAVIATSGVISLGPGGTVTMVHGGGGGADFLIDAVGYYIDQPVPGPRDMPVVANSNDFVSLPAGERIGGATVVWDADAGRWRSRDLKADANETHVADSANNYSGSNVEEVLAELPSKFVPVQAAIALQILTQVEYDGLADPDENTLYVVIG